MMKEAFSAWAPTIDRLRPSPDVSVAEKVSVLRALELEPGGPSIDLGCAVGMWTAAAARLGYVAEGVDFSPEMVARAEELFPDSTFLEGDVMALEPCGKYQLVTAMGNHVTYHADLIAFMQVVRGLLAPDGVALIALQDFAPRLAHGAGNYLPAPFIVNHPDGTETIVVERRRFTDPEARAMSVEFHMLPSEAPAASIRYTGWAWTLKDVKAAAEEVGLSGAWCHPVKYMPVLKLTR